MPRKPKAPAHRPAVTILSCGSDSRQDGIDVDGRLNRSGRRRFAQVGGTGRRITVMVAW